MPAAPASAQFVMPGSDVPVDVLLDELAAASSAGEARRLERRIIEAWSRSGSPTVDLLMQRATVAMEEKNYPLALEYLDTVVEIAPRFAEGWNKRATLYYTLNAYQRAVADIGRVLALEPRHFGALSGLGTILREIDRPAGALTALRRALEVNPHIENVGNALHRLQIEVEGREI